MPPLKAAKDDSTRKRPARLALALHDLDRVKLTKAVTVEGTSLRSGLEGTVVLCHGSKAYEVEFDGIEDFFAMEPDVLKKFDKWQLSFRPKKFWTTCCRPKKAKARGASFLCFDTRRKTGQG